ncbi:MAG TPA: hypothetical protein PLB91_03330 [Spirochaetales bacterium]|nr:hypothetical protein [Spirochaetales bacterium]HRY55409.1 hypothetical protein [Spirochaetia bacterium]HRZ64235.1 hypothetical protein [Spirochaetia bacterium]
MSPAAPGAQSPEGPRGGFELSSGYDGRDFSLRLGPGARAPAGYPEAAEPDPFAEEAPRWEGAAAYRAAYEARREAYLGYCLRSPAPPNLKAPFYELPRIAAGRPPHEGILGAGLDYVEARKDCADFVAHAYLRLLLQFPSAPSVSPALYGRAEAVLLGFKYWPSEPGTDSLCTWTENHQILYASLAYVLGSRMPRAAFASPGIEGAELAARARPRILRWLSLRFRTGFSEWLSNVYYDEDLTALLTLVDFADPEVAGLARDVATLLLLDLAQHSFRGVFGSTHGRSYEPQKKEARLEATSDAAKLLWGMGAWSRHDSMSAPSLALSPRFEPPPVLAALAAAAAEAPGAEIRQRMGIRVEEAGRWGLGYEDPEDGMVFLSLEAYNHPRTIGLTFRLMDEYRWWENEYFAPFRPYRRALGLARSAGLLPLLARALRRDVDRNCREEADLYSYRTPDYLLSSAQDCRFRYGGDQQSIWQASLGPGAVCFVTHPGGMGGHSPDYWTGNGSMPRVAQSRNLLVALYDIDTRPGLYRTNRLAYTHAWLPEERFDGLVEEGGWLFARRGRGYLALRPRGAYRRVRDRCPGGRPAGEAGAGAPPNEVVAEGRRNIWICRLGREAEEGSFAEFRRAIAGARLEYGPGLSLRFEDPAQGLVEFSASGPFRAGGRELPLRGYPRYGSPWARAAFPAERVEIEAGGERLVLERPEAK